MRIYRNYQSIQKGAGLGSIIGKMFRFARPLLSSGLRAAKPHLIRGGKETAKALLQGKPLKQTIIDQSKRMGRDIIRDQLDFGSSDGKFTQRKKPRKRKGRRVHIEKKRRRKTTGFDPFA